MIFAAALALALAAPALATPAVADTDAQALVAAAVARTDKNGVAPTGSVVVAQAIPDAPPPGAAPPPTDTPPTDTPPTVDATPPADAAPPQSTTPPPPTTPVPVPPPDAPGVSPFMTGLAAFGVGTAVNCVGLACCFVPVVNYLSPCLYCLAFPAGAGALQALVGNLIGSNEGSYLWPMLTMMGINMVTYLGAAGLVVAGYGTGLALLLANPTGAANPAALTTLLLTAVPFAIGAAALVAVGTVGSAAAGATVFVLTSEPKPPEGTVVDARRPRVDLDDDPVRVAVRPVMAF